MPKILQSKNLATRFQILVEIAAHQPNIQQRLIAERIGVTPQAISDYVSQLLKAGLISSDGRSRYSVTKEGADWVLAMARELREYSSFVEKALTNISVCTAIAEGPLKSGQTVGLKMRDGLLWASPKAGKAARGVAVSDAEKGDDVGVSEIEGIVELKIGQITIAKVPGITRGGSAAADIRALKSLIPSGALVGAIGLEALSFLRKAGTEPRHLYGVEAAIVEAAYSGLPSFVACVEDQVPSLIRRLETEGLEYSILDPGTPSA